ncbi:orotate phosphoribosyltransferase [Bacillus cereus]|nr:orotate phosphoribosyltransferase [Bacillus anthracis]PEZ80760.1 orotate phosphoribosyltransferase [Bacillus anthracis]PFF11218.1 orotate phosphoribosyltransferase [Bacillus cereus]PFR88814.1 orotate phosphoribosyltransferase [Bacillus cereus]PGT00062.1 orotate phosphoribosyltransferase [Bacillus anthracis]
MCVKGRQGMEKWELAKEIYNTSRLTGTFKLRSGQVSNQYFDKYLFESNPVLLVEITKQLKELIPPETEVLAGLEMGGIPVATALSLQTGIPVVFVRKEAKKYGTCKLAEGVDITGKNVCVVEDVITTGGQILLSTKDLRELGVNVHHVLGVIERTKEGRENLLEDGLQLHSLFTMDELIEGEKEYAKS